LPRYSVIAADTLRDLVTLTFDLLTLVSGHTWRVTWSTPPPSFKILRLSVLELWVLTSPIGYHWQERAGHLEARFQGEGVVPGEYFLVSTKLDTFCYPAVQTAPCYVPSLWHNTGMWRTDRQTDGRTDGIVVANAAIAMRALRAL